MHHILPLPDNVVGSKNDIQLIPLKTWTWSKPDILSQLARKASDAEIQAKPPEGCPDEPQFSVFPTPYNTPYKFGQLIRMHVPINRSSFFYRRFRVQSLIPIFSYMESISEQMIEAARRGDSERVVSLARSNPFISNSMAIETALLVACEFGQLSVVRSCIEELRCNPNCVDKTGRSPLHLSVTRKENGKVAVSIIKYLVSRGAKLRKSVLHVCNNDLAIFPLIDLGADVNAKSVDGLTPVAVAVSSDRQEVVTELVRSKCEIEDSLIFKAKSLHVIKELVRSGVDINTRDRTGRTALQYAVEANNKRLARALLECKADPNLVSRSCSSSHDDVENAIHTRTNSAQVSRSNSFGIKLGSVASMSDAFAKLAELMAFVDEVKSADNVESMIWNDPKEWESFHNVLKELSDRVSSIQKKCATRSSEASTSLCVVCRAKPKSVVLLPCKHMCCCQDCSKALFRGTWDDETSRNLSNSHPACPICRSAIQESVSVFT